MINTSGQRTARHHSAVAFAFVVVAVAALPFLGSPAAAAIADTAVPAPPVQWATDTAGFLSEATRVQLDARLRSYENRSGQQVLLWIGRTTGGVPIEDWAARAFAAWRVGRKGLDDGVVLFLMSDDRKVRIEVGYGLEGRLPDGRAAAIIRERIVPRLRVGDRDGAAAGGVDGILRALGDPQTAVESPPEERRQVPSIFGLVAIGFLGLLFLGLMLTHPQMALLLLTTLASGRSRGGGGFGGGGFGGGGGGFSGGGGRSGGGGATGSW